MENITDNIIIDTEPSLPPTVKETNIGKKGKEAGNLKNPKNLNKKRIKRTNKQNKNLKNLNKKEIERNDQQNKNKKIFIKKNKKILNPRVKYNVFHKRRFNKEFDAEERRYAELLFNSDDENDDLPKSSTVETESSSTQKRKAVWEDEEDLITVKEVVKTYSKAKDDQPIVNGKEKYAENLREKFTNVYGNTPEWAQLNKKAKIDEEASDSADDDDKWDPRKKTTSYLSTADCGKLPKSILSFKFIDDLNKGTNQGNIIQSVDFISSLKIALVAGFSFEKFGAVTLFQFNGKENFKIKSVLFPQFPIKCAKFLASRQRFVVGCNLYPRFFVYDIEEGRKIDIQAYHKDESSSKLFEVSPDEKYIAFVRNGGSLDIYDANSLSPFETLQVPCNINAIAFSPDSASLYTTGDNGQVYIFDLFDWRCRQAFYDEGCVEGTAIAISPNGLFLACGSSSGIINVYQTSSLSSSTNPKPIKTFGSLVTKVTSLVFNHTSEMLAAASSYKENAIKLIHTGSLTVFSNFPGKFTFKRVHCLSFSPDSKYLVTGDDSKRARLCRLLYY